MKKASQYAYLERKQVNSQPVPASGLFGCPVVPVRADLNVFVLTFDTLKEAEKNLAGGDSYGCKKCGAILNKFSIVQPASEVKEAKY
jgi:hypothetical protein